MTTHPLMEDLRSKLQAKCFVPETEYAPYLTDWTGEFTGKAIAVLRPGSLEETVTIVKSATAHGVAITPQGGNTGLVGGSVPISGERPAIVIQMGRMNAIREVDTSADVAVVEAGCILADLQNAAGDHDRRFPLALGSEGTAQIGGLIATNAGGIQAHRFGMMRDLVLGIEAVLADGTVVGDLRKLTKSNLGPNYAHLLAGSEGTLGLITAASLKLVDKPKARATAFLALSELDHAISIYQQARSRFAVDACELIARPGIEMAANHLAEFRDPVATSRDWSLLIEAHGHDEAQLNEQLMGFVEELFETGQVIDGTMAASETQRQELWYLREAIVEGQRLEGNQHKHDVGVPRSSIAAFIASTSDAVIKTYPDAVVNAFGHVGDGNIHFNVTSTSAEKTTLREIVYDRVLDHGGTISAEHGLGRKKNALARSIGAFPIVHDRIRSALDPNGLFNPGCL